MATDGKTSLDLGVGDDEDFCFTGDGAGSAEDNAFDEACGAIENVLMDPGFSELQTGFANAHCNEFEEGDENKLSYTPIFESYCAAIEGYLQKRIAEDIEGFSLAKFAESMSDRKDEISGDVFDLLLSLSDFGEFKELMLEHKRQKRQGPREASDLDSLLMHRSAASSAAPESPVTSLSAQTKSGSHVSTRCESKLDLSP